MFNALNRIYLVLGDECNLKCRYCIQTGQSFVKKTVSKQVIEFIRDVAESRGDDDKKLTLMFWGGEPLLYFSEIKKAVEQLGHLVDYCIVSNGSLLDETLVGFINEYNINFVLSCDGQYTTNTRRTNVMDNAEICLLFNKINNRALDCVVSAYSQDIKRVWEYFDVKAPNTFVNFEFMKCSWDMPADLYQYDLAGFESTMDYIINTAYVGMIAGNLNREYWFISQTVQRILDINNGKKEKLLPRCQQTHKNLNVDVEGNVLSCHNFGEKIGSIADDYFTLVEANDCLILPKLHAMCLECKYLQVCAGACPYSLKDSVGQQKCCELQKIYIDFCIKFVLMFENLYERVCFDD